MVFGFQFTAEENITFNVLCHASNTVTLKINNLAFLIEQVLYKYLKRLYKRVHLNLRRLLHQHNNLV